MEFVYKVPKKFQVSYLEEQIKYNFKNVVVIGIMVHLIQLFAYISTKMTPFSNDLLVMRGYYSFYAMMMLITIPYLLFMAGYIKREKSKSVTAARLILGYVFLLMFWAMGVALADQFQGQDVVVYYVAIFFVAIVVDLSVKDFAIILLIVQGIFITLLPMYFDYIGDSVQVIDSSFQYIFFGVVIRYYVRELRKKNFVQNKRLEKLNDELYFLSFFDPLSELYNRRKWEEAYNKMHEKAKKEEMALDVIITDIDYFKQYNDTYGHVAGDQIIRDVSRILIEATEGYERNVGRYGGDEFALSLYHLAPGDSCKIVEAIQSKLMALSNENEYLSKSRKLSMSFGCCRIIPKFSDQPWDLIVEADQMLYREKASRNKVVSR